MVTLAIGKHDTVYRMLSKALADNQITDSEFQLIMTEFSQYKILSGQNSLGSRLAQMLRRSKKMSVKRWTQNFEKITALAAGSN